jgi:hypothetical protein
MCGSPVGARVRRPRLGVSQVHTSNPADCVRLTLLTITQYGEDRQNLHCWGSTERFEAFRASHQVRLPPFALPHIARHRSSRAINNVPVPQAALYYSQRATDGGLMISEATAISPEAYGCVPNSSCCAPASSDAQKTARSLAATWHQNGPLPTPLPPSTYLNKILPRPPPQSPCD